MTNTREIVIKRLEETGKLDEMTKEEINMEVRRESFKWLKGSKYYSEIVNDYKFGNNVINLLREAYEKGISVEHFSLSNSDLCRAKEYIHRSLNGDHSTFTWSRSH